MRRTALFVNVMAALHGEVLTAPAMPEVRASTLSSRSAGRCDEMPRCEKELNFVSLLRRRTYSD
jgi:hypothetical protein